jgi:predicted phage terminase large subunit-like protein
MSASVSSIVENFEKLGKQELVKKLEYYHGMKKEWLKRQIIEKNRIDILATEILGYQVQPLHLNMLKFQFKHPDSLQLAFRGAGKSTVCTIAKSIHYLLKNPNFRILIVSKTTGQAESFLKEIKAQFEDNDLLAKIFGPYYDPRLVKKWDNSEIEVLPRTARAKEASVTTLGVGSQIVGKHYDAILCDDLVDEENSRTEHQRDKVKAWYYTSLDPTLEPSDDQVEHRGEYHRLGTRYHHDDLYHHLMINELKGHTNIQPALDDKGRSAWPEKYSAAWFLKKKKKSGIIIFNAQYQCDTEAMKGKIFQYDDCQFIESENIPSELQIYMGVDLAITQAESADKFAICILGMDKSKNRYILDFMDKHLRFGEQTASIIEFYEKWKPIRCCIEINAYQQAQYQHLQDDYDTDMRLKPITQIKDKITRAWKLSHLFENKKMFFKKGGNMHLLVEQLVLFPNYRFKDLFDALDLAVKATMHRKRKSREKEPGLI